MQSIKIWHTIVGCKVNRKEAPINVELESGQTVEIITSKKKDIVIDPHG